MSKLQKSRVERLRELDRRANRVANRSFVLLSISVAIVLVAMVLWPIVRDGPSSLLEGIVNLGFSVNEGAAEGYQKDLDPGISLCENSKGVTLGAPEDC